VPTASQDPRLDSNGWALVMHGVAEKLFTLNADGEIVPEVAQSAGKVSEFEWDIDLKPDYKFSDGTPVTAQDVANCLNELHTMNDNTQSSLGDIEATVPCDGTVRIKSTKATPIMDAVLADYVFVVYKKVGTDFVYTGPYKITEFVANDHVDLVPNTYYPQHTERRPIKMTKYENGAALAADAANLDIAFKVPVDTLDTLRNTTGVNVRSFGVSQTYMRAPASRSLVRTRERLPTVSRAGCSTTWQKQPPAPLRTSRCARRSI
jgi:ABC-type transport system substrate-binding protein